MIQSSDRFTTRPIAHKMPVMLAHSTSLPLANVAFRVGPVQPLTYRVPPALEMVASPGTRVLAPLGRRAVTGFGPP